jgi:hypothetical protein
MRRRTGIASGVIVVGVLLFGAAFVLQHAGLLQNRQDRDGRHTVHPLSRRLVLVPAGATRRAVKALAVAPLQAASVAPSPAPQLGRTLLAPRFSSGTRLVTND